MGESQGMTVRTKILRRYTSLPALLHLLRSQKLTLLSPENWKDRNDAFFMSKYKELSGKKAVLAVCFSGADERYHFWRVFTHGTEGVCIEFYADRLRKAFDQVEGIKTGWVRYKKITDLSERGPKRRDLPFLKRAPYKDEREFRVVYVDGNESREAMDFDIEVSCISRITMNPWLPRPLLESVRKTIQGIKGCRKLKVSRTTLLENEQWKQAAEAVQSTSK